MSIPSSMVYYIGYEYLRDEMKPKLKSYNLEKYSPVFAGTISRGRINVVILLNA